MKRFCSGLLLLAAAAGGCGGGDETVVLTGPVFLTGDPELPEAAALSVDAGGRILAVHAEAPPAGADRVVVLPGVIALPGLHDAHLHLLGVGRRCETVDLLGVASPEEARERVAAFAAAHPEAAVIEGRGWDQNLFSDSRFPSWRDLDGAAERPVHLRRVDGHASWVNRALLDLAGLDAATPDPEGGRLLRDADGVPSGILVDNAADLLDAHLPQPTDADRERWLIQGMAACADAGLTAVSDMGLTAVDVAILLRLDAAGRLPLRVFGYLEGSEPGILDRLDTPPTGKRFVVQGVKHYADGALGSRGAALLADYADDPGNRGLLIHPSAELQALAAEVDARGGQLAVHAIGDRAVREVLDAFAALPEGATAARRPRVEHAQNIDPTDMLRLESLGAVASMQPTHCTSDMGWVEDRLGPDRLVGAYAWRTLSDLGVPLAFGSDAPVESENPLPGIWAAISRRDTRGEPPRGWRPQECLGWDAALAAFTSGAAWAVGREDDLGRLAPGYRCDLSLLDRDPRRLAAAEDPDLTAIRAVGTVVDGTLREPEGR